MSTVVLFGKPRLTYQLQRANTEYIAAADGKIVAADTDEHALIGLGCVPETEVVTAAATAFTATAGEIDTLSGITSTAAELNTLHGVTAGATSASKALVAGANNQLDALNVTTLGVGANRLGMSGAVRAGQHSVTSGEATATTVKIGTGITTMAALFVQITHSAAIVTADANVAFASGTVTISNGSTYTATGGDVINWMLVGA